MRQIQWLGAIAALTFLGSLSDLSFGQSALAQRGGEQVNLTQPTQRQQDQGQQNLGQQNLGQQIQAPVAFQAVWQTATPGITFNQSQIATTFNPPDERPTPSRVAGGSARQGNRCQSVGDRSLSPALTAVLPHIQFGITLAERPTLLIYLPEGEAQEAFVSLKDSENRTVYEMDVTLSDQGGVVSIPLPEDAPSLKVGQDYHWYFVLKCSGKLHPRNPFVEGWIRRVEPDPSFVAQLQGAPLLSQVQSYGRAGVWYDAVATLARLQQAQPTNLTLTENWLTLLGSVGLQEIATAPLVELP